MTAVRCLYMQAKEFKMVWGVKGLLDTVLILLLLSLRVESGLANHHRNLVHLMSKVSWLFDVNVNRSTD